MASRADINAFFQQFAGRPATRAEFDFLGKFIDSNELSLQEVGEIVQGTPEARQRQVQQLSNQFSGLLAQGDAGVLDQAQGQIESRLAKQGRSGSSARIAAFARVAENLARDRQRQVAQFAGGQLQGIGQQTRQQGDRSRQRGFGVRQDVLNRQRQLEDFQLSKNAFNDQLRSQGIRNFQNAFSQLPFDLAKAGAGAAGKAFGKKFSGGGISDGGN